MKNPQFSDLYGKIALVTGGTGALGTAISEALLQAGVHSAILSRQAKKFALQQVENAPKKPGRAFYYDVDVTSMEQLQALKSEIYSDVGVPDLMINAAGGNRKGATINPDQSFADFSEKDMRSITDLNLLGTLFPIKTFLPEMVENGGASIVNISSMAADRAITRVAGYSASKAAIDNFTRWLAVELATKYGDGFRVNAIAPGFFVGEQNRALLFNADGSPSERAATILRNTPFNRFGKAEELNGTLLWLLSNASSFVTGAVIPVDGGFSAWSGV